MIGRKLLEECLEGAGRRQKILGMVLTVVRNNGRTLRPMVSIIRQSGSKSSIGRVVVNCKDPQ